MKTAKDTMPVQQLKSIHIYPVKGLRRVSLMESLVELQGLAYDRRWMLVSAQGTYLSQRQVRALALLRADVVTQGLRIRRKGVPELMVTRPGPEAPRLQVTIWGNTVQALCADDPVNRWLAKAIGQPCRLVYMDDAVRRPLDPAYDPGDGIVSFADGYPLLLTSAQSLVELNARMPQPLSMHRFRPNIVVDGFAPFAEDDWKEIQVGSVRFHVVKSCARCVVTTIDPETAKSGKEPLRTLSTFRRHEGKVYFGENLVPQGRGTLRVGDSVTVLTRRKRAERHRYI